MLPRSIPTKFCPRCNHPFDSILDAFATNTVPADLRGMVCVCVSCGAALHIDETEELQLTDVTVLPQFMRERVAVVQQAVAQARHARS